MEKELIENINKVPFLSTKLEKIEKLLKEENYIESYRAVAALIEIVCIVTLEKVYNEKVEDSNIVILASMFEKNQEKEIKDYLIDINGEYNHIQISKTTEIDVLALIGNLDDLVKIILEKHGNIF